MLSTLAVMFDMLADCRTPIRSLLDISLMQHQVAIIRRHALSSIFIVKLQCVGALSGSLFFFY